MIPIAIVSSVLSLGALGAFSLKLQQLKRNGQLTSIPAFISTIPIIFRLMRFMYIEKKVKKNYYLNQMGGGKSDKRMEFKEPSFRLCDKWTCRETDVICAVPLKSGTTWCQQICQQLRVNGDSNVNYNQDLTDVQPWIEAKLTRLFGEHEERPIQPDPAAGPGAYDMDADHADSDIRCFKSHLPWRCLEGSNCKIIYFYRNDVDVVYSLYRFVCGSILEISDSITPHQFATLAILTGLLDDHLESLCSFWEHRNDTNVEFFFYDDVVEEHYESVERIAEFMGIEPKPELIKKVVEQSTVDFMSAKDHHLRFDGFTNVATIKRAVGINFSYWPKVSGEMPQGEIPSLKVAKNSEKKKRVAATGKDEVVACYKRTWARIVFPRTGFATVEDMRAAWKKERASKLS